MLVQPVPSTFGFQHTIHALSVIATGVMRSITQRRNLDSSGKTFTIAGQISRLRSK
jgi:hypothetical protein